MPHEKLRNGPSGLKQLKTTLKNRTDRKATKNMKICSASFIDKAKSEHPSHPSYVPTIFHGKPTTIKSVQAVQRFERQECRSLSPFLRTTRLLRGALWIIHVAKERTNMLAFSR